MRARWVKPEFFLDRKIAKMGPVAALVYQSLWVISDDYGTAPCDPDRLNGALFYCWGAVGVPEITEALQSLSDAGRIDRYRVGDDIYCRIKSWDKHQKVHKPGKHRNPVEGQLLTGTSTEISGDSSEKTAHPHHLDTYTLRHLDSKTPRHLDTKIKDDGANAPNFSYQAAMGLIRKHWKPTPEEQVTNGSTLKAVLKKGELGLEFEAFVIGLPMILKPHQRPTMLFFYAKDTGEDTYAAAVQAYHQSRKEKPVRRGEGGVSDISEVLDGIKRSG